MTMFSIVNFDDDDLQELQDLDDYNIIPRPQEVIDLQRKSSGYKPKQTVDSSNFGPPKGLSEIKPKVKEKKLVCKHGRKGSAKVKLPYKTSLKEKSLSKKRVTDGLDNKFEMLVKNAKSSLKNKSESSKTGNESSNQSGYKDVQHLKIMDEPAITPQQRYQVLDARDAAIRSRDAKQEDSRKTKVLGCCPDMCPEKERYNRIAKNCLSVLEMKSIFNQSVPSRDANHSYMVKEYSRSSADQQEPLPHELRPVSVLMFTMDYLICNIMDIPLDNITLSDWYDFIWNRTRSIRKDITQQQICDVSCVDIIEKCVRFHIHCAEALSEEDTSTFDPKINNENLTKCLQTLKHMYHDLQSRGIQCPNEAEFRAYDILLSLTEGETLRLVKDIRKDMLKTPMVRSAFEAALAFKSNNYVKFFKIMEKADYLSSCILHRYILEARSDALQIIVRAYSTPSSSSMFPTSSLVKDLKFEDATEAYEFCKCHGLEGNENYITIERRQFSKSASGLPVSRSFLLVGSKRKKTLGEVINSEELPQNPLNWYQPHDSFNDRNILKKNSIGTALKKDDKEKININNEMEEASVDVKSQHSDSSFTPVTSFEKIPNSKLHIKNAKIVDLEKARTHLLEKIGKLQTRSYERLKDVKSASAKLSQKKKEKSSKLSVSKSHKSIMFSDDSNVSQEPGIAKSKLNFVTTQATTASSSNLFASFGQKDTVFSKFSSSNVLTVSDAPVTAVSEPVQNYMPDTITTASSLFKLSTPTLKPAPQSPSLVFSKNSTFQASQPIPVTTENVAASEIDKSFKDLPQNSLFVKNAETDFSSQKLPVDGIFESFEREENFSPFEELEAIDPSIPVTEIESIAMDLPVEDFDDLISSSEESDEDSEEMKEQKKDEVLDVFAEYLAEELFTESIEECATSICKDVLHTESNKMLVQRDEHEMIMKNLMRKTITKWKYFCDRKRQRRQFENSTLCSPWQPMLLNTPYVVTGVASPMMVYKKQCNLSRLTAEKMKRRTEIPPGWEAFKIEEIFDLTQCKTHSAAYFGENGIKRFFKLCIVLPAESESCNLTLFKKWIHAKFALPNCENSEFNSSKNFVLNDGKAVFSVRAIQLGEQLPSKYKEFLNGTTAMILCFPCFFDYQARTTFLKDFSYALGCDVSVNPYPLFVLHLEPMQNSTTLLSFVYEDLYEDDFSTVKKKSLSKIHDYCENSKEIFEAVNWLIEKRSSYPELLACDFRHYLENSFSFAFNILFCKISLDDFTHLKQFPQHIIDFYNKVIKFKSDMLCSDLMMRLSESWPPNELKKLDPEFKFIDNYKQQHCKHRMKLMCLPNLKGDATCIKSVLQYVEDIANISRKDEVILTNRIDSALKNSHSSIDWLCIIYICALHIINAESYEYNDPGQALHVYYIKEDLESFDCDEFWQDVSGDIRSSYLNKTKRKWDPIFESSLKKPRNDVILESTACDKMLEKKKYISNAFDVPDIFSFQRKNLFTNLETAIAKQKEESDVFLHHLDETVISGNVLNSFQLNTYDEKNFPKQLEVEASMKETGGSFPDFSPGTGSQTWLNTGSTWLDNTLQKELWGVKSVSSIADQLSELKYNIQKSNILEDHFTQLLSKQV